MDRSPYLQHALQILGAPPTAQQPADDPMTPRIPGQPAQRGIGALRGNLATIGQNIRGLPSTLAAVPGNVAASVSAIPGQIAGIPGQIAGIPGQFADGLKGLFSLGAGR